MPKTKPEKVIDENLLKKLASIMCTMKEMSDILGVSVDTLERRYADLIKEAQSTGKMSLRRWQFQAAEKGNTSMLIWLGKQILNQHEKIQHTTQNPLETKTDEELEKIILEASEKIKNGTRLIPSGKD
jgi:DNA-binding transcriptional MocR family regulator